MTIRVLEADRLAYGLAPDDPTVFEAADEVEIARRDAEHPVTTREVALP